jgi:CSLREA domain-containing protein
LKGVPRICGVLACAVAACAFFAAPALAGNGGSHVVPLMPTAPAIDGTQAFGEWDAATSFPVTFGSFTGTAYVGRNATEFFFALKVNDPAGHGDSDVFFDNNDDGVTAAGDDLIVFNQSDGVGTDWYAINAGFSTTTDTAGGGTNDVTAAQSFTSGVQTFEYRHPLCGPDIAHDFCFTSKVGFAIGYRTASGVSATYPTGITNAAGYGEFVIPQGPTNGRILYDGMEYGTTELFSANPDGTVVRRLTNDPGRDEGAQYSPDGSKIVWGSDRSGTFQIYTMNADGSGVTQLTSGSASGSSPAYSPDGTKIAYTVTDGAQSDIWVMNADGSGQHDVTNSSTWEDQATWSPAGTKLAFNVAPAQGADADVWVENVNGTGATNLTPTSGNDHDPAWSPDGTTIAFASNRDTVQPSIWLMNADGTNQRRVFNSFAADPAWSPDGSQILFSYSPADGASYDFNAFDTWAMNADGSNAHAVVANAVYDGFPNWGTAAVIPGTTAQSGPTYTVNTASDDSNGCTIDECSLRQALLAANAAGVAATINFAILSGTQTISLGSPLPKAAVPITIDGSTQPGTFVGPAIEINGSDIVPSEGTVLDGLVLGAGSSTVRGLAIEHFAGNGIVVSGNNDLISANVIGSSPDGTIQAGNNGAGIRVEGAAGTHINGNLVSGSGLAGILVTGGSTGTVIHGNKIGTDATGTPADNGNAGPGIQIGAGSPKTQVGGTGEGDGNRIADNGGAGVLVASSNNPILSNSIEANAGGGIDLGFTGNGLQRPPLVAAATTSAGTLNVIGKFLSPAGTYRLEYFLNTGEFCAPGRPTDGATLIGTSQIVVGAGGEAALKATLDVSGVSPNAGSLLTVSATSGSGNTSEFSVCRGVVSAGTASASTLTLTTTSPTTEPGASSVPLSDIPASAFATSSTDSNGGTPAAPLGAIPLGAIPLGAIPLGAIPLGAIPLGAIGFTPQALLEDGLGGVPLNTIPLKAPLSWESELQGTPLAGLPIQTLTLRDVLTLPTPPANLTTAGPGAIGLKDLDLSLSPLGAIPLGAIALGASPLGAIPISGDASKLPAQNVADWCAQIQSLPGFASFDCSGLNTETVMGVAIQGIPLGAIPLGAIPLGAIPLGAIPLGAIPLGAIALADSPLGAIPLGAINLGATPLGAIPLGAIPLGAIPLGAIPLGAIDLAGTPLGAIPLGAIPVLGNVVDCTLAFNCAINGATLGQAAAANALKGTATLRDLGAYGTATLADLGTYGSTMLGDLLAYLQAHPEITLASVVPGFPNTVTFRDLLAALMGGTPPSWEQFPLAGLQDFAGGAGATGGLVTYRANFSIAGTGAPPVAIVTVTMPAGARFDVGSATLTDTTTGANPTVGDPLINGGELTWPLTALAFGDSYTLSFKLRPGFDLGNEQASATLSTIGLADKSAQANVTVGDTFESNDTPAVAPAIAPSTLYVSYLGNGKDVDYSTLHIDPSSAPAGTRIKIFLSHLKSDADLAVFGPVDPPLRSAPLGAIPLGAITVGDQSVKPGEQKQQLAPDTAQDLPFGTLPAGDQLLGVSDNRGTADEEVDITSTGLTGDLIIQVSSYDGHPAISPYVLRVQEDLPPALPPCTQTPPTGGVAGEAALPTSIPATAQTLILFNQKRLSQYYSAADAHTVYTKLQAYAARSDVNGVIVPVEKNVGVAAAYADWDHVNGDGTTNLCSPAKANAVVSAIGTLLSSLQAGHPNLKSIVVVGTDNVIPFGRTLDQTQQANELGFRSTFGLVNNEYVGAVAAGYLLTDDPYADPDPQAVVGGSLYVPKLALGRLVESPADINRQLDAYTTNNGLVNPKTKLVTGYDFLTDGSQAVDAALGRTAPNPSLISDTWTADNLRGELFPLSGALPLIDSLNAHYDQHRALSAKGNTLHDESAPNLFTTTDVKLKGVNAVLGRIVFTMGCHAGFSLFDNLQYFTGGGTPTDFALDWPQAYMAGGAIEFMGNTGYGLGDTVAVAYSERLNQLFAQRLDGTMTIGEALEYAKQEYIGDLGVVSPYDVKVANEATLYGIPTYRLGTGTPPPAPSSPPTHTDGTTGLTAFDFTVNPTFTLHSPTGLGNYYSADDPNGLGIQDTNRRPVEPLTSLDITQPGTTAHGVLVTSLVSHDVDPFTAAFGRVTIDASSIEPQLQGLVDFPASIQSLATLATPNGQRQRAVLIAGHFSSGPSASVGKQRLFDTIGGTVLYSSSADFVRPTIRNVQVLQIGTTVGFEAEVADLDSAGAAGTIKQAIVLYLDGSHVWQRANLTCASGRCTGGGPLTGTSVDYIAEAVDAAGNVGVNANKAAARNVAPSGGSGHISISYGSATPTNGWFTTSVTATLSSDDGASLSSSLDGAPFTGGATVAVSGDGLHILDARGSDGSTATFAIPIDISNPTIRLTLPGPTAGLTFLSVDLADFSCSDAGSGIAANGCVGTIANGSPLLPTNGLQTFTVTATDNVGKTATLSRTYIVWQWSGFFQPVDNPPTLNSVAAGQSIPVKFSLGANRGLTPFGSNYPASQQVTCASNVPVDPIETTVTSSTSGMNYDAGSNTYTYVWKTDKAWAGTCRDLIMQLPSGSVRRAKFTFK